ncbi:MAG TPA: hypothetical protein VNT54_07075 [Solirubrobacteraceae bacterium]|nr:hypothetical protein [Solirubrobacteraceae bacterium]
MDWKRLGRKLTWRVDDDAMAAELTPDAPSLGEGPTGGRVVFQDEHGQQRRLPADIGELTAEQRDAAIAAMSQALGAPSRDDVRTAAIERLTELRAAGRMTEEQFQKERRRLEDY